MPPMRTSAARYARLLEQLAEGYRAANGGKERGFKKWAGDLLAITPEHVGMLRKVERTAGGDIVDRAIRRLKIRPGFFHDEGLVDPDHRDFLDAGSPLGPGRRDYGVPAAVDSQPMEIRDSAPSTVPTAADDDVWLEMYLSAKGFEPGTERRRALERRLGEAAGLDGRTPRLVKTLVELILEAERPGTPPSQQAADAETEAARTRGRSKGHRPLPPRRGR